MKGNGFRVVRFSEVGVVEDDRLVKMVGFFKRK